LTDQLRFQVFVSSTYQDLREARQAVTAALLECEAFPTGMEIFPAADDDAWTLIKKVIDESDYYLLIMAGKYGSTDEATGISYTEKEFDYAVAQGKPVMAFLHGDPDKLMVDLFEKSEDARGKLEAFRSKVESAKHVKYWTTADQLAGQVALTYNKFVRLYAAVGWIRADRATSTEALQDLADARKRVDELTVQLDRVRTVAPEGANALAQGGERVRLVVRATGDYRPKNAYGRKTAAAWMTLNPTWDQIFSAVAPGLLQESAETDIRNALDEVLLSSNLDDFIEAINKRSEELGDDRPNGSITRYGIAVQQDDFGTILVQLMALGLIQKSERKRSVTDTGTYWSLTPYGENRTIQLRALRRGQTQKSTPEDSNPSAGSDETSH
jgi:hypothetical protein